MRKPTKPVSDKVLKAKLSLWQKKMDMADWEISIEYADAKKLGEKSVAMIEVDEHLDRIAKMYILQDYYKVEHYNVRYNLDTIILHELCHAFMNNIMQPIPGKVRKRIYLHDFEEWLCDNIADLIYFNVTGKFAKKVKK